MALEKKYLLIITFPYINYIIFAPNALNLNPHNLIYISKEINYQIIKNVH
jgi:hypothetical protein